MTLQNTLSLRMLNTLLKGENRLSDEARKRTSSFVRSQMTENGGFMDKSGKADLYYTPFGLMLTHILQLNINPDITEQWLDKQDSRLSDLVSRSAYVRSRMLCKLLKYGKSGFALNRLFKTKQTFPAFTNYPHNDMYSPYSQFMSLSLREDMDIGTINRQEILSSLSAYRVESGGFTNIKGGKEPSTNATVAALAVKGQLCGYTDNEDIRYLFSSQDESGGFFACPASPVPDLLSTATALFMLKCYAVEPQFNADDFIDAHWLESGGFGATFIDESGDAEYTFYGLLALGAV